MLKNLKKFINIEFKIEECQDEVYESSDEEDGSEGGEDEMSENQTKV